ncbi:unnamed protein product, partial [Closterium sp. NIES-53]
MPVQLLRQRTLFVPAWSNKLLPHLFKLPSSLFPDSCDGVECGPDSSCNSDAECICNPGYNTLPDGTCTESCSIKTCGAGEECLDFSGDNGESVCRCLDGYVGEPGSCLESCSIKTCGAGEECLDFSGDNGESVCRCLDGYVGEPGSCLESCSIKTCGAEEECLEFGGVNGESVCRCLDGYSGEPGSCVDLCDRMNCGTNSFCKAGICGCNDNYVISPFGNCTEPCAVDNCGTNALCFLNASGSDTCACKDGYTRTPSDGCMDSCVVKGCGANTTCVKGKRDLALCICNQGFRNVSGECIDVCEFCDSHATCETDQRSGDKTCRCNDGYYMLPNNTCAATCIATGCDFGSSCVGDVAQDMYCADNCNFKGCHDSAMCVKDAVSGKASCQCSAGFTMQSDGSCKDDCESKACGERGVCEHDPVTLEATCICFMDGTVLLPNGTCIEKCSTTWCSTPSVCRDDITCTCGDNMVGEPGSCLKTCDHPDVNCSFEEECIPQSMEEQTDATCACKDGYLRTTSRVCAPTCKLLGDPMSVYWCGIDEECRDDLPNGIAGTCDCRVGYNRYEENRICVDFLLGNCTADNCGNGNCVEQSQWPWWSNTNLPSQYCKCNDGYTPDPVSGNCTVSCPAMPCPYGYLCDTSGLYPVCKKVNCPANCPRDCVWNSQKSIQACP